MAHLIIVLAAIVAVIYVAWVSYIAGHATGYGKGLRDARWHR